MTRKTYNKKMRALFYKIREFNKANGYCPATADTRINRPLFGTVIKTGSHAGEIRTSYKQCWEDVSEIINPILSGEDKR